jgi:hypothetical protein
MQQELNGVLECWDRGETAGILFNMKLKDEPRKPTKVARTFSAGAFVETVLTRMLFGGFFDYLKKFRGQSEHAVGINCCNAGEWKALAEKLGGLEALLFVLDAKDFDIANTLAPYVFWYIWKRYSQKCTSKDPYVLKMMHYMKCLAREQFFYF